MYAGREGTYDDNWEIHVEHGGPFGAPAVVISKERFDHLLRVAGKAKKRAIEHKLDDYVNENVYNEGDGPIGTVVIRLDPLRIVGRRYYSREVVNALRLADPEATLLRRLRREVKQLLYDMVMQDVAEHPEDYQ